MAFLGQQEGGQRTRATASGLNSPPASVRLREESEGPASQSQSDLSSILPEADPWPLTPDPFPPRGPHHAVGKSKPIGVGDDLQEDVHGIQYVRQDVVFAIFTDNLQERTERGQGEGWEALLGLPPSLNRTSVQPVAAGRGGIRPLGTSFA